MWSLWKNTPKSGSVYHTHFRKTPQNRPFLLVKKIRLILALFAKIRPKYTSPKAHQRPLNRAGFCHLFYPIRVPKRPPEREYEGRIFRRRSEKMEFEQLNEVSRPIEQV